MFKQAGWYMALVAIVASLLCGCDLQNGSQNTTGVPQETAESHLTSQVLATSGGVELKWDADRRALLLCSGGNLLWASMPYEQYAYNDMSGAAMRYLESHLLVEYVDPENMQLHTALSYTEVNLNGRMYEQRIADGIRITYYFDRLCLAIPVEYRLVDGAMEATVDAEHIYEDGNWIYSIAVLPYAASVLNLDENAIFLPDGSGMLMNCGEERKVRSYSAKVYGDDLAVSSEYQFMRYQPVSMPCYGVRTNTLGLFCIVTQGEASAKICATAGDTDLSFSYAYTRFFLRGMDYVKIAGRGGQKEQKAKFSTNRIRTALTVRFYPLTVRDNGLSEMAACYRRYLIEERGMTAKADEYLLYLDMPMAARMREFIFGIPVDTMKAVTSYTQAREIIRNATDATSVPLAVRLSGIQSGGLDVSKIAGGYSLEGTLGSKRELEKLIQGAQECGAGLFPDFDLVRFRISTWSFSRWRSAVKTPTTMTAYRYFYSLNNQTVNSMMYRYMLLKPSLFAQAVSKLTDYLNGTTFENVSLSSWGSCCYSDYGEEGYYVGIGYAPAFTQAIKQLGNRKIMLEAANQYAAVAANIVLSPPTSSTGFQYEDGWAPFYQMVFKGYVALSSQPINLCGNERREILRAAQTGSGLLFTVCGSDTTAFAGSVHAALSAGTYDENEDSIVKATSELQELLTAVQNASIVDFSMLDMQVYQTRFSNGIVVTVNYGDTVYADAGYTIDPESFIYMRAE